MKPLLPLQESCVLIMIQNGTHQTAQLESATDSIGTWSATGSWFIWIQNFDYQWSTTSIAGGFYKLMCFLMFLLTSSCHVLLTIFLTNSCHIEQQLYSYCLLLRCELSTMNGSHWHIGLSIANQCWLLTSMATINHPLTKTNHINHHHLLIHRGYH